VVAGNASGAALTVSGDFKFGRAGAVSAAADGGGLRLAAHGLRTVEARPREPLKFTGLTQNLGQLYGSDRGFQSNCWVNL
jgi:hypothetical protein